MAEGTDPSPSSASSIFSQKNSSILPDDTIFFSIFPDFSVPTQSPNPNSNSTAQLQSLHLEILQFLSPHTSNYIWQHEPFTLSPSSADQIPHFHGKLRYGDNLEDEWFVVFLLFEISRQFPSLSIRVWDTDGEFLLIEAAFHLPRWLNPNNSTNRVFIRRGNLHIIPKSHYPSTPTLLNSLLFIINSEESKSMAADSIQSSIKNRIKGFSERPDRNIHKVRVRVPVLVAQILKHEPSLISLAVEGFYDRDIESMKYAAKMDRFLPNGSGEEFVEVLAKMSKAMYGQLVQQTFQAPKCYPMPARSEGGYAKSELGMKIACGFEMIYQLRKRGGAEGKGSTWEAFTESLEKSGYFRGLLPGSNEYRGLMEDAEEYYRNSSLHSRASDIMSAPVRRIDEILDLPCSADNFKGQELPPSDDDSWLYNGEDELNAALLEREKEMELYNLKDKKKEKSKEQQDAGLPSGEDFGLGEIAKSMQAFVKKMSTYEGAEVPENRNLKDVDFDADRFMKDIESVMKLPGSEGAGSDVVDIEEGSSSDMDFDDSDYESDDMEPSVDNEVGDSFMGSYSDALNEELKTTTLDKSFVRANEQAVKKDEGTSNAAAGDEDEEFAPIDVDVNLVKSFLDSFSSQEGLPGPASNLLGLMGLQLPQDAKKEN